MGGSSSSSSSSSRRRRRRRRRRTRRVQLSVCRFMNRDLRGSKAERTKNIEEQEKKKLEEIGSLYLFYGKKEIFQFL